MHATPAWRETNVEADVLRPGNLYLLGDLSKLHHLLSAAETHRADLNSKHIFKLAMIMSSTSPALCTYLV